MKRFRSELMKQRTSKRKWLSIVAILSVTLAACGSTGNATVHGGSPAATGLKSSAATGLKFDAQGVPVLNGLTITMGNAAGSAHIGDTNVYDVAQFLKQWGATVTLTDLVQNEADLAVATGRLNLASGPFPVEIDAGLTAFGPNQARVDYVLVAKDSITSLAGLKGKSLAVSSSSGGDYVLMQQALKLAHLSLSEIKLSRTGTSSNSLNELISGRVDAGFIHSSGLSKVGSGYHTLATGATLLPSFADSFMAAESSWIDAHPNLAEAVDLAWLASAKLFNTDEATWVQRAAAYTKNADPLSIYKSSYVQLKAIDGWPDQQSTFTGAVVGFNVQLAKQQGAVKGSGNRPLSKLVDTTPWNEAWAQYSAHESSY